MQPDLSHVSLGPCQPPWRTSEPAKLWLEDDSDEEISKVEIRKREQQKIQEAMELEIQKRRKWGGEELPALRRDDPNHLGISNPVG
jgi:hypothetical protein